ncbi:unnamed protein product [Peniophora sp. CBMAI 1063]|nr:unnamed protein product [Peniophora sp. CBMAI 1063]
MASSCSLTVPAPPSRHRASSCTNIRPALTLATLGSRPKSSAVQLDEPVPCTPPANVLSAKTSAEPPVSSRLSALADKFVSMYSASHPVPPPLLPPTPSDSARSSVDDHSYVSSPSTTLVGEDVFFDEKAVQSSRLRSRARTWLKDSPSVHAPLLFVFIVFPLSTAAVILGFWSLPFSFSWPQNITDLAQLGRELRGYSNSGSAEFAHVFGVMAIATIWMHAWSVPGSVLWNVLAGALFSPALATVVFALLTTLGSICATLLSTPIAPFITHFFPKALNAARGAFEGDARTPVWIRVTILRLVGVVPWSGINVACGVIGVPIWDCFVGTFIGSIPWTAVTCQIGDILQTVVATPSPNPQTISSILMSPSIIVKLALLSALSLAPILGRDYLRSWLSPDDVSDVEERASRWAWVAEWRSKVRSISPSRSRERERKSSEDDVRMEKELSLS